MSRSVTFTDDISDKIMDEYNILEEFKQTELVHKLIVEKKNISDKLLSLVYSKSQNINQSEIDKLNEKSKSIEEILLKMYIKKIPFIYENYCGLFELMIRDEGLDKSTLLDVLKTLYKVKNGMISSKQAIKHGEKHEQDRYNLKESLMDKKTMKYLSDVKIN